MPPPDVGALVLRDGGAAELEASSCGCDETGLSCCDHDPYDAPAESLRLRIGEDIDWSDVIVGGAVAVLERDDSTKGAAANPKSCAARRSAAARSSLSAPVPPRAAAAVVIGGLPSVAGKAKKAGDRRRSLTSPCHLQLGRGGGARVFASGEATAGGRHPAEAEPGSPKVSCLGGVRSQPRTAADGITSGARRWWAWQVADVMSFCCCWKGRRDRAPTASEAE